MGKGIRYCFCLQEVVNVGVEVPPWREFPAEFFWNSWKYSIIFISTLLHETLSRELKFILHPYCPFVSDDSSQYATRYRRLAVSFTVWVTLQKIICFSLFSSDFISILCMIYRWIRRLELHFVRIQSDQSSTDFWNFDFLIILYIFRSQWRYNARASQIWIENELKILFRCCAPMANTQFTFVEIVNGPSSNAAFISHHNERWRKKPLFWVVAHTTLACYWMTAIANGIARRHNEVVMLCNTLDANLCGSLCENVLVAMETHSYHEKRWKVKHLTGSEIKFTAYDVRASTKYGDHGRLHYIRNFVLLRPLVSLMWYVRQLFNTR